MGLRRVSRPAKRRIGSIFKEISLEKHLAAAQAQQGENVFRAALADPRVKQQAMGDRGYSPYGVWPSSLKDLVFGLLANNQLTSASPSRTLRFVDRIRTTVLSCRARNRERLSSSAGRCVGRQDSTYGLGCLMLTTRSIADWRSRLERVNRLNS
jgi:hypothetical protein